MIEPGTTLSNIRILEQFKDGSVHNYQLTEGIVVAGSVENGTIRITMRNPRTEAIITLRADMKAAKWVAGERLKKGDIVYEGEDGMFYRCTGDERPFAAVGRDVEKGEELQPKAEQRLPVCP